MACPASGTISIQSLVDEFGGTAPHSMSEYYRNGGEVPGNNTNVPTSGTISLSNFYSAVNEIQQTYSSTNTNLNLATVFGSNWGTTVPKRVIINSSAVIGATSGNAAILIPSGMGGTLVIDNSGSIQGHGGSSNGGTGGNAIHCSSTSGVTINNSSGATIKAGGGGGGQGGAGGVGGNGGAGGQGGQGRNSYQVGNPLPQYTCGQTGWCGTYTYRLNDCYRYRSGSSYVGTCWQSGWSYTGGCYYWLCMGYQYTTGGSGGAGGSSGGAGGAGGAGGVGQGYNQSNTSGSSGAAGSSGGAGSAGGNPGNGAGQGGTGGARGTGGQGGTGGAGGTFGNAGGNGLTGSSGGSGSAGAAGNNGNHGNGSGGSSGNSGNPGNSGSSGGQAGYYISNRASITFNNSGTVAGR